MASSSAMRSSGLLNQRLERILEARLQDLAEPDPVRLSQYQYRSLLHQRRRLGLLLVLIIALLSLFAVLRRCGARRLLSSSQPNRV